VTGKDNNQQMTMIPGSMEHTITTIQNHNHALMEEWTGLFPIERIDNPDEPFWRDIKG
jgi:hypothetical protein